MTSSDAPHHETISRRKFLRRLGLTTGAALVGRRLLYAEDPQFHPFSFVQMSDMHIGKSKADETFRRAVDSVEALRPRPAFLLITGDLSEKRPKHYERFLKIVSRTTLPLRLMPGNHDVGNRISRRSFRLVERYRDLIGEDRYAFTVGPRGAHAQFIVLNSLYMRPWGTAGKRRRAALAETVDAQWTWLEEQLAASAESPHPASTVFVCLHHPLFSNRVDQRVASYLTVTMKAKRRMLALCDRYRVQAVLAGHSHRNRVHTYRGTTLLTTPSVFWNSPELRGGKVPLGYRVCHVRSDGFEYRYRTLDIRDLGNHRVKTMKQVSSDGAFCDDLSGLAGNPRALVTV